jgi:hypothetical protein
LDEGRVSKVVKDAQRQKEYKVDFTEAELVALLADRRRPSPATSGGKRTRTTRLPWSFGRKSLPMPGIPVVPVRGSFNPLAQTLTFAIIHANSRRIYALD